MNKTIIAILLLLSASSVAAFDPDTQPYMIDVLVWDADGEMEAGVPLTVTSGEQVVHETTAPDGSCSICCEAPVGTAYTVSCEYGIETVVVTRGYYGTAVTFNAPDEQSVIWLYAVAGFIAVPIGRGLYLLRKKYIRKRADQS